jgi:hypothetical protein
LSHLFCATFHMPPARSQSVLVVYFAKSPDVLPLGLAEGELGEVIEPPEAPGAVVAPPPVVPDAPEPLEPPDVPAGPLPLELPGALPLLPPVWAAAKAGARATIATNSANISFCMVTASCIGLPFGGAPRASR